MNKKYIIYWAITVLILLGLLYNQNKINKLTRVKNDTLNQLQDISNSDELVLVRVIKGKKEQIKTLENLIKETEETLKKANAYETCYKTQLDRLINWLEYNLNYCTDNLEDFF